MTVLALLNAHRLGRAAGLLVAVLLLVLMWRRLSRRDFALAGVAVVATMAFLFHSLVTLVDQTREFRRLDLRDAGLSGFGAMPPVSEAAMAAARDELAPGETWTLATPAGDCLQSADERVAYAQGWARFRLFPNQPACPSAPVAIFWRVPPGEGPVVAEGPDFVIVRRP